MIDESLLFRTRNHKDFSYVVMDTETESLNLVESRAWEIAFCVIENGKITEKHQLFPYIKDLSVSKGAAVITRFDYSTWKEKATDAKKCMEQVNDYLYNPKYYIIGLNWLRFDIYQVANNQTYCGMVRDFSYLDRMRDLLAFGRAYKLQKSVPEKNLLSWQYGMVNRAYRNIRANLKALAKDLDVEYDADRHHEGIYDVILTHNVFQKLIYKLDIW